MENPVTVIRCHIIILASDQGMHCLPMTLQEFPGKNELNGWMNG